VLQGSQEQEVKFQDQIFSKFQEIFVGFTRLKTEKMHTLFTNQTEREMISASKMNILRQTC